MIKKSAKRLLVSHVYYVNTQLSLFKVFVTVPTASMGTAMPWEIACVQLGLLVKDVIDVRYGSYKFSFQKQPFRSVPMKRCSDNMQQIYRRTLMPHFGMGVLLQICCIFSEHLSLRTPLEDCFWLSFLTYLYKHIYTHKKSFSFLG